VIALCHDAATRLARHARGPVETIAPGLDPEPAPDPARIAGACERQGLPPGRFALYTGNVDGYQGLDLIAHAARSAPDVHWVVATHGERGPAGRQVVCVRTSPEEARLLLYGCGVALLPRRCPGGFPIKLLNYLEAARPVVAFEGVADGLVHGDSAWLLERDAEPDAFRDAALALLRDEARGDRIGAAGRVHLEQRHGWRDAALRTLLFCAETAKR
jgi:glycosyltransferase involved in cell wall biosynthesis